MESLLDVVRVEAKPDYTLFLEFENGEKRVFDMAPLMDKEAVCPTERFSAFYESVGGLWHCRLARKY